MRGRQFCWKSVTLSNFSLMDRYLIPRVDHHTLFLKSLSSVILKNCLFLMNWYIVFICPKVNYNFLFPLLTFYFIMNEVTVQLIDGQFVGYSLNACITWVFLYSFILILFLIMMSVATWNINPLINLLHYLPDPNLKDC